MMQPSMAIQGVTRRDVLTAIYGGVMDGATDGLTGFHSNLRIVILSYLSSDLEKSPIYCGKPET